MLPSWSDVNSGLGGDGVAGRGARVRAWCASWRGGCLLALLCVALYLPGLGSIPPVDRDECRFAQSARQMLEAATLPEDRLDRATDAAGRPTGLHAGGWAVPMYANTPRLNKPPLTAWAQAGTAWVLTGGTPARDAIWMYRVPSVLAAIVSVLLTWRLGLKMTDARAAWLAGALLAAAPMMVWDAHQARADQLMVASVVAAQLALWSVFRRAEAGRDAGWLAPAGFWLAVGLSVMIKGPIGPMVVALGAAALALTTGRWRWLLSLRPVLGAAIVCAVVAPWLWVIDRQFGLGWYAGLVWQEVVLRAATGSREGHFAPPGTHLVLLAALFWPGCLLALAGVGRALRRGLPAREGPRRPGWLGAARALVRRRPGRRAELFLLCWLVPGWVVFELSLAKLPHYTMPLYPALALLSARMVFAATGRLAAARGGTIVWLAIGVVPGAGLLVAAGLMLWSGGTGGARIDWLAVAVLAVAAFGAAVALAAALQALRARAWVMAQLAGLLAGVMVLGAALQFVAPEFVPGARSAELVRAITRLDPEARRPVASTHHEDSMVFGTRGRVARVGPADLVAWAGANPTGLVVVGSRDAAGRAAIEALHRQAPGASVVRLDWGAGAGWEIFDLPIGRRRPGEFSPPPSPPPSPAAPNPLSPP